MVNEELDTTNKLIKHEDISMSDDDVIKQLSENLQDITPEDVDSMCDEIEEEEKKREIPQELRDFRKIWDRNIDVNTNISVEWKEKIIKVAEKIPVKVEKELDGSRIIEFKLWNKKYKILDVNIDTHTDEKYMRVSRVNVIMKNEVKLWWMMWDDIDKRENKKLKSYVKAKENEWLHIPKQEEIRKLLDELWKIANLDDENEQVAMLMYLTGMFWEYWLNMHNSRENRRNILSCEIKGFKCIQAHEHNDPHWGEPSWGICMIACEDDSLIENKTSKEIEPVENNRFKNIGTIAWMTVEYDERARTVKFWWEIFDLNPFEWKLSFMSKVGQYADLFSDEDVRKVMFILNI